MTDGAPRVRRRIWAAAILVAVVAGGTFWLTPDSDLEADACIQAPTPECLLELAETISQSKEKTAASDNLLVSLATARIALGQLDEAERIATAITDVRAADLVRERSVLHVRLREGREKAMEHIALIADIEQRLALLTYLIAVEIRLDEAQAAKATRAVLLKNLENLSRRITPSDLVAFDRVDFDQKICLTNGELGSSPLIEKLDLTRDFDRLDYIEALSVCGEFSQAIQLISSFADEVLLPRIHRTIAEAALAQGRFDIAAEQLRLTVTTYGRKQNALVIDGLIRLARLQGKVSHEDATQTLAMVMEQANPSLLPLGLNSTLLAIAAAYVDVGRVDLASAAMQRIVSKNEKINHDQTELPLGNDKLMLRTRAVGYEALVSLADTLLHNGHDDAALLVLRRVGPQHESWKVNGLKSSIELIVSSGKISLLEQIRAQFKTKLGALLFDTYVASLYVDAGEDALAVPFIRRASITSGEAIREEWPGPESYMWTTTYHEQAIAFRTLNELALLAKRVGLASEAQQVARTIVWSTTRPMPIENQADFLAKTAVTIGIVEDRAIQLGSLKTLSRRDWLEAKR